MPMQLRKLGPVDERPLPKKGRPESVIPMRDLKKTKDGLKPKVPAFEVVAKIAMYWDGCCIESGHNYVDVARFDALPKRTRKAVKQQIEEGAFMMRGYREAKAALAAVKPKAPPTVKRPDPKHVAQAAEIEITDDEDVEVEEFEAEDANTLD